MDENTLKEELFPPYQPSDQEVLDKLTSIKIAPLEQSIADLKTNFAASIADKEAELNQLYAIRDGLQNRITPQVEETPEVTEPTE